MTITYHTPTLLDECIDSLNIDPQGVYVDATFGSGGHAWEIFQRLDTGRLLVFDHDKDARSHATRFEDDPQGRSFTFINADFRHIRKYLTYHGVAQASGIIADFGVSFHQFDTPDRGFSTRFDGPLDMRMNQSKSRTAADIIAQVSEKDLTHYLTAYGEIGKARKLARRIISARTRQPIKTTRQLKETALGTAPRGRETKYLAQVYQAIRIVVNEELKAIEELLNQTPQVLKDGGRLVTLTYHSLEDRLVKNFLNSGNTSGEQQKDLYGNVIRPMDPVNKKPIMPTPGEIEANGRSRSAKLRIGQRRHGE